MTRPRSLPVLVAAIAAVALFALGGAGCSHDKPCDALIAKICDAGGKDLCATVKEARGSKTPTAKDQAQCKRMLEDDDQLRKMVDQLRAAAAAKAAAGGAKAAPAGDSKAAPAKPQTK